MNIDKNQTKLAAEVCRKMADLASDLELTHNVRAHAIKTSLKYTLQACGLIECKRCHEFASVSQCDSGLCADCETQDMIDADRVVACINGEN